MNLKSLYSELLDKYGPQGWWPINGKYHPANYDLPLTENERFEVCVGAILTQNTTWKNVEKSLTNLHKHKLLDANAIFKCDENKIKELIKPSGYYNQKTKKLKIFSTFFLALNGKTPTRYELLGLWGIGKETADSILCYAYKENVFVIDIYTKRLFLKKGLIKDLKEDYDTIQMMVEKEIITYNELNEFHALIVEENKSSSKNNK